ncbi:MAG: hypothetical protein A3C49_04115 [Candidatus Doudnabacteria bacterium RIFCSPHIGHO2_02_FULL_42_25]|uniref:Uncharacterized protein n=1 Tax=Candidatus Doudnabacteria bacterium RIFCSPHIGHO2_01_FULL_41_86 TaxID=1817821 RepID=A0A1F5N8N6_9BACT|nr:MAG: hypothetical protein A2717_00255 [Candidatus Doudnabacteria bacterium RIFCSPHIGHO2_01_FULL_41_86]OGE86384.1 MAG: hypothetical protein A3E28_00130 [Candidatus Doudnabacteria bacterium RIFCSPHIGHO2_12_FULL_42_22]OGE87383.1 MAG: hypothetical protein A3C49_04115 [Candidatus Doudnabacteria bacterium RIFCSPHIGHO2_02_FULL_42_25]OGE92681.1 MAG: hypothetical protein A2895_03610 [Candidatus Doudnabacteria bacterium RIFCSPLOWO2_01_FULL_42_60]OGE94287.1 MAG: hypothetical protein A3K08_01455 [Candid
MDIREFAKRHGISVIVRRHFGYRKPVTDAQLTPPVRAALTYSRNLDDRKLGLLSSEVVKAMDQGRLLVAMGITPRLVIVGDNQRNWDGGRSTAEAITDLTGLTVDVWTSPAVTYPHYANYEQSLVEFGGPDKGDFSPHRYLAGKTAGSFWSEPPHVFADRVSQSVLADYGVEPVLFDLNFEQVTLCYYKHVKKLMLEQIPTEGAWIPTMGGGIVYSSDRQIAMEFRPDLTINE